MKPRVHYETIHRGGKRVGVVRFGEVEVYSSGALPLANYFWNGARWAEAGNETLPAVPRRGTAQHQGSQHLKERLMKEGYRAYKRAAGES